MVKSISLLILILAFTVVGQDFQVQPDSLEGRGRLDALNSFHALIINLWDQENVIHWETVNNVPEAWTVEICQGTLLCWPPWVNSADFELPAFGRDTIIVKFRTSPTPGIGRCTLGMTAQANANFHQEWTFVCQTTDVGVSEDKASEYREGFGWSDEGFGGWEGGFRFNMPFSSRLVRINLYDMLGNKILGLYEGPAAPGVNFITPGRHQLPAGVFILRLE